MANVDPFGSVNRVSPLFVDVVIIGGGLAGTLAAVLLGRAGFQVALIDLHHRYPPDFRAEQLVGDQVEVLRHLGLLEMLVRDVRPVEQAVAMRAGRVVARVNAPHYGIRYDDLVNQARQHLPSAVQFIKAQVVDIDLAADTQWVTLSNGDLVGGRLVVLATGLGQRLLRKLDIGRTTIRDAHSLTFGFDLAVETPGMFNASVLVVYGQQAPERIDYLTIFSIENKLRANLFTYGDRRDPWAQRLVQQPADTLLQVIPDLAQMTARITAVGPVQSRVNDLTAACGYRRAGVVLIGDAFQTSCPAAGTGIGRLLNDIRQLCTLHIPNWLTTEGMGAEKVSQFYDDPIKHRCDAEALRVARYRRSVTTEAGLLWKVHRQRVALQNQLRVLAQWVSRPPGSVGMSWAGPSMTPIPSPQVSDQSPSGAAAAV